MKKAKRIKFENEDGTKRNVTWMKRDYEFYNRPVTDEDRIALCKQMAQAQGEIDNLNSELREVRADFKSQIDEVVKKLSKAALVVRRGTHEAEKVKCDVYQDWDSGEIVYISADEAHIEILRRPMKDDERQPSLFPESPEADPAGE